MKHLLFGLSLLAGCWLNEESPPHAVQAPPPTPAPADAAPGRAMSIVTSSVIVDACPSQKKLDRKAATREIEALVGGCQKVPGGIAHFSVTLLPDGRVELASPSGDTDLGVVPTCVLETSAAFRHKLRVPEACRFDVKLEERHVH
jgi:hypothetical protein